MGRRLVVGISGASGAPIAVELLRALRETDLESHLIISDGGAATIGQETDLTAEAVAALADVAYRPEEIGAGPASGSFLTEGMVVVPCSMKTAAGICVGYSDNLLLRAADVTLKERRKLVLVARECPLGTVHLRNLYELSQMGAVVLPPVLTYYDHPQSVHDLTCRIVARILDQFGVEHPAYKRWEGMA